MILKYLSNQIEGAEVLHRSIVVKRVKKSGLALIAIAFTCSESFPVFAAQGGPADEKWSIPTAHVIRREDGGQPGETVLAVIYGEYIYYFEIGTIIGSTVHPREEKKASEQTATDTLTTGCKDGSSMASMLKATYGDLPSKKFLDDIRAAYKKAHSREAKKAIIEHACSQFCPAFTELQMLRLLHIHEHSPIVEGVFGSQKQWCLSASVFIVFFSELSCADTAPKLLTALLHVLRYCQDNCHKVTLQEAFYEFSFGNDEINGVTLLDVFKEMDITATEGPAPCN